MSNPIIMAASPGTPVHNESVNHSFDEVSRVVSGTALVLVATGFGLGLNFVYSIGLARWLGPDAFGLFAIGLAAFNIVSILSTAGLDNAALRFLPAMFSNGATGSLWPTVRRLLVFTFGGGMFLGGLWFWLRHILAAAFFHDPRLTDVFVWFAVAVPFFALSSTLVATLQAMQIVSWRLVVKYICEPAIKALATALLLWAGWGLQGALIGFAAALAVTTVLAFLPLRSFVNEGSAAAVVSSHQLMRYSVPLVLALLCASLGNRSDILLLGYFASPTQAGIYGAAFQTASIIALVLQSFESILQPLFSNRLARADLAGLNKLYQDMLRWVGIVSVPLFLLMSVCAKPILSLYGAEYEVGVWCLILLSFAQCVNSLTATAHSVLVLAGYSRVVMWNSAAIAVLQILLNVYWIPRYGVIGAALATSVSLIGVNLVRAFEAYLLIGLQPVERKMWKPLAAGLIAVLVVLASRTWLHIDHVAALACGFLVIYGTALQVMGLHVDDRKMLTAFMTKCNVWKRVPVNA